MHLCTKKQSLCEGKWTRDREAKTKIIRSLQWTKHVLFQHDCSMSCTYQSPFGLLLKRQRKGLTELLELRRYLWISCLIIWKIHKRTLAGKRLKVQYAFIRCGWEMESYIRQQTSTGLSWIFDKDARLAQRRPESQRMQTSLQVHWDLK